jgi:hypothetical protein
MSTCGPGNGTSMGNMSAHFTSTVFPGGYVDLLPGQWHIHGENVYPHLNYSLTLVICRPVARAMAYPWGTFFVNPHLNNSLTLVICRPVARATAYPWGTCLPTSQLQAYLGDMLTCSPSNGISMGNMSTDISTTALPW